MPDLGTQIQVAKTAGYSDADIAAHLATDPTLGPKVAQAKAAGYGDSDIVSHLAGSAPAPAPHQNLFQRAGQLISEQYHAADTAYRADTAAIGQKLKSGSPVWPVDLAKPVMDAAGAAFSPVKGGADAVFGDKAIVGGMTGGDLATFAIPVAGEMSLARGVATAAKAAGVSIRTMENTLAASRAPISIASSNPAPAAPKNDLAATVRQFDQAGVRPSLAAAQGGGAAKTANFIAENAMAGGPARANMAGQAGDVQAAAGKIASQYGAPADRAVTGEAVQQGVQDFNQRFSDRASALYDKAFAPINQAHDAAAAQAQQQYSLAKVQTSDEVQNAQAAANLDYRNRAAQAVHGQSQAEIDAQAAAALEAGRRGVSQAQAAPVSQSYVYPPEPVATPAAPRKAAVIQPNATASTLAQINARGDSPALKGLFTTPQVQTLTAAIKDPASLSFQDLRDARTWVRNAQGDDTLRQGVSKSDLSQLEGSLTQDINSNAASIAGPKAARQLQRADQFYRLGSQRIQNSLQAFVGKTGNAPGESAYDLIQRAASDKGGADTARLTALKNSLKPSEWGDVAASTVDRMGQPTAGAANANEPNAFSLSNFVSNYAKMSDRGKGILFGQQPGLKAELDNLASVAGKVKAVEKGANASNSGVSMQNFSTLSGLSAAGGSAGTALMNGHPIVAAATVGSAVGGLLGLRLTGSMMTNPDTVRWLARLGKAQENPAAMSSAVGRLGSAARANPALVPLYQQAAKALAPPSLKAAATSTSPSGQTQ